MRSPREEPRVYPRPDDVQAMDAADFIVPFTQILAMDNDTPSDPNAMGDTGTGFSAGLFRVVRSAVTTQVDGVQENMLIWELDLTTWLAAQGITFDPAKHLIELIMDWRGGGHGGQIPTPVAADGAGCFAGVQDRSGRTGTNGSAMSTYGSGASGFSGGRIGNTSSNVNGLTSSLIDGMRYRLSWALSGSNTWIPLGTARYRLSATGAWGGNEQQIAGAGSGFQQTTTNWKIITGASKHNANSPTGIDQRWRLFVACGLVADNPTPD